jgi:hypothetical protein
MTIIAYKILAGNLSPYQKFKWPLPTKNKPSKWLETKDLPVICQSGFHGYPTKDIAYREFSQYYYEDKHTLYEMELDGKIVYGDNKVAASRARLLRKIPSTPEPEEVTKGWRNCLTCGKPHNSWKLPGSRLAPQWYDPVDKHTYNPEPWEVFAARITNEHDRVSASHADIKLAQDTSPNNILYDNNTFYRPVAPSWHNSPFRPWAEYPDRCGDCGLDKNAHDGWEKRAALREEFRNYDQWDLLLVIQAMREGNERT